MLKITAETAVVIETFAMLGASVRVCSSTRSFIRDDIAAAVTYNGIPVFGKQDQTLEEHKRFMNLAQDWGSDSPDVIICDSPLDDEYDTTGSDNTESRNFILKNENKWIVTDFEFLYSMAMEALRGTHAINATRELDNTDEVPLLQSHRYFLPGVLKRATKGKIEGKKVAVLGYSDAGKECASTLMNAGAHVVVVQDGYFHYWDINRQPVPSTNNENAFSDFDIIVYSGVGRGDAGEDPVIKVDHMKNMKKGTILCNIGGSDNEIDMRGLQDYPGVQCLMKEPGMEKWVFPDHGTSIIVLSEGRPMKLGCVSQGIETIKYYISKIWGLDKYAWLIIVFFIFYAFYLWYIGFAVIVDEL